MKAISEAVTATFRDSIAGAMGIFSVTVASSEEALETPSVSPPNTKTVPV
jgi:hypothetical protein